MCNAGELNFDDIKTPPYTPDVSIVIGQTTYTIQELISELEDPNLEISEDNTKLLSLAYRDTTFFNDISQIITLDDITNSGVIEPNDTPIPGSPSDQDVIIPTQPLNFEYDSPNNEELDSLKYTAGTITLDIQSGYTSAIEFEMTINDIVDLDTGQPLVFSSTLPASGSQNVSQSLVNHKTVMVRVGNVNQFSGQFDGVIKVKTGDFIIGTEQINYTLTITGAAFSEIYGWFGDKTVDIQDQTIEMNFFEGLSEFGLYFNQPEINFYIDNSFGVPMGMNLDGISASNAAGTNVNLSGDITTSPQLVRAPSTSQVDNSVSSLVTIDEENSNLRDLLAISPTLFSISIDAEANFNNPTTSERNFVTENSEVEIVTEVNLPLDVRLTELTRDFGTDIAGFEFEDADTINLILTSENQLPFSGTVNMQFLAADSTVLFEFTDVLLLVSPEVPTSGKIEEPLRNSSVVKVYRGNGYQELLDADIVNMEMTVHSYKADEDNYVKVFSDYQVVLKIATQADINHEL